MRNRQTTHSKLATVRGVVIPVDWDRDGNVIAVGLSGRDEEEYLIDDSEKGAEIFELVQEEVEVSGLVRRQPGKNIITVKMYNKMREESHREDNKCEGGVVVNAKRG